MLAAVIFPCVETGVHVTSSVQELDTTRKSASNVLVDRFSSIMIGSSELCSEAAYHYI